MARNAFHSSFDTLIEGVKLAWRSLRTEVVAACRGQLEDLQQGEIEMGTCARLEEPDGSVRWMKRGSTRVRPGQVQVYLPGDIHDMRCMTGPALLFRFTERDLNKADKEEHRVTRYVERDGVWTVGSP